MTTARTSAYPTVAGTSPDSPSFPDNGQFDQLRDFVDRAAQGEIDLEIGNSKAIADDGKLPSGWYAGPPEMTRPLLKGKRLRPEVLAGLLGLAAGLVLLMPLAFWWQQSLSGPIASAPLATSFAVEARPTTAQRPHVDVLDVKPVSVAKQVEDETVIEARSMLADGDVLAARALLSKAVAARDPDGVFLMAETYDPNILAAHRARGVGSDTERARALYMAAKNLGHTRAGARLEALR